MPSFLPYHEPKIMRKYSMHQSFQFFVQFTALPSCCYWRSCISYKPQLFIFFFNKNYGTYIANNVCRFLFAWSESRLHSIHTATKGFHFLQGWYLSVTFSKLGNIVQLGTIKYWLSDSISRSRNKMLSVGCNLGVHLDHHLRGKEALNFLLNDASIK